MKRLRRYTPPVLFALILLLAWEVSVILSGISPIVLPKFSSVVVAMVSEAPLFFKHMMATSLEVAVGFAFAIFAGAGLGTIIALSDLLGRAIYPALVATQVMPKVAIAPLLIIWFGFGIMPKVVLTALIAFFPIVINTIVALRMTTQESMYLFQSMGATPMQAFFKLRLPNALPVFFGGLKVASTLAVIGAVVGEFSGADEGLGYLLTVQVGLSETAGAFASVLYLTGLGLVVFAAVVIVEHLMVPAHMLKKMDDMSS